MIQPVRRNSALWECVVACVGYVHGETCIVGCTHSLTSVVCVG